MVDVALFPIPNLVSFPGVPRTLHVFEPRYRQMVDFCIEHQSLMGVCGTEGIVRANTREQTREEILSSNQSTYKPSAVFSAGPVELLDTLEDGRMMAYGPTAPVVERMKSRGATPLRKISSNGNGQ